MPYENAKANLKEFSKELGLELQFDDHHTCTLSAEALEAWKKRPRTSKQPEEFSSDSGSLPSK